MTTAKNTKILLEVPAYGLKQEFSAEHAEKLLRLRNNGGWILPEDSKYEFDLEYGLRLRTNTGRAKGKQKSGSVIKGEGASEQD